MSLARANGSVALNEPMATSCYIVDSEPEQTKWIESALARTVDLIVSFDLKAALSQAENCGPGSCMIAFADGNAAATAAFVRGLRDRGILVPVVVLGPHSAFREAVEIARMASTDFLERPVSTHRLRAAVRRALTG
jgi:DNA-binding NtrC family response regulator